MAIVSKSEVIQKLIQGLRLDPGREKVPKEIMDKIQPVFLANPTPVADTATSADRTTTGASTVITTPTDKDFFLTGAMLGYMADATSDGTLYELETTINGATVDLLRIRKLTTTAGSQEVFMSYPVPVKIDRGVTILIRQTFTVGASNIFASVTGYTEEP